MKKLLVFTLIFAGTLGTLNAQNIKFKKGDVLIDGVSCLDYTSSSTNAEIITKDGNQTIILKYIRTGVGHNGGLYTKVVFVEHEKSFTSKSYIFNKKLLVKKLLSDAVIVDCGIDESKIDKFIMKYDEGIEETLVRH
tara:strand:+ start:391 stop:801 length:411 start_codon:yes stop_codon:yes gene_type:complete